MPLARLVALGVLAAVAAAIPALAQPDSIKLANAWARRAAAQGHPGGGHAAHANGAVYVTIANHGGIPDAVIGAVSDAADKAELHQTRNEGGIMKMYPLSRFDIPAGGQLEMKPGGHHVMLLGLRRELKPGDRVKVTLTFEKAGPITLEAPVR